MYSKIKLFFCLVAISFYLISCNSTGNENTEQTTDNISEEIQEGVPEFQFDKTMVDFGNLKEGEKVTHTYKFKNIGDGSLIISTVRPTCGCTVPDWSQKPIPPGGEGTIKIVFNTNHKVGKQTKHIIVIANTKKREHKLSFTAQIEEKQE